MRSQRSSTLVGSWPTRTVFKPMAWVCDVGASTMARMTDGTLSTSPMPVTPPSVCTLMTSMSVIFMVPPLFLSDRPLRPVSFGAATSMQERQAIEQGALADGTAQMRLDQVTGRGLEAQIAGVARPDPGLLHGRQGVAEATAEASIKRLILPCLDARGLAVVSGERALHAGVHQIPSVGECRLGMSGSRRDPDAGAADRRA